MMHEQQQMSGIIFGDLPETPSWAFELPASFQLVQNSEFPPLRPAAAMEIKPLTVATFKRPAVAEPKAKQAPQPAAPSAAQMLRALVIEESVHAIQLALTNPQPRRADPKSPVCNLQSRMTFIRSSNGNSFTSDVCVLPTGLDISKCGDWSKLSGEVSVKLHAALAKQLARDDFTVSVRFFKGKQEGGKQLHNVTATVAW